MSSFLSKAAASRLSLSLRLFTAGGSCRKASSSAVSYPLQLSSVSASHGALYEESLRHPERFWGDLARRRLTWYKEFDQVMDCDMRQGRISWFGGGKINVSGRWVGVVVEVKSCSGGAWSYFFLPLQLI